ncbi:glycoside hydrolase family 99-like domain-containing protein [Butyrivibrio sp. FCS006]|uniref:glycoside hydrolase family 99-like domain-containing protein n=1 Tax=Butyrivibrio sp. FCS006 TaxID=1280684 RepID=UPI000421731E|nr:glycoside hydrolase family 99-like domain-containing protein [Butyrivibrio sp. FCS006]
MTEVKIIANYLPQYHEIEENNKFWGEGYTDWEAVKKAKPIIKGQKQPKVPYEDHYYKLDNPEEIRWQANLARQYGVYGFGIYHYWFSTGKYLLEKPAEIILADKSIDIHFMFLWDNSTWKRTWSNVRNANDWAPNFDESSLVKNNVKKDNGILMELVYGGKEDWKAHFEYLLPFFRDERYIKIDGKPMFGIFQPQNDIDTIKSMIEYWDELAKRNGFPGMYSMVRDDRRDFSVDKRFKYSPFVYCNYSNYFNYKVRQLYSDWSGKPKIFTYDECWNVLIKEAKRSKKDTILSGFVKYDDTPRRGKKAKIAVGATPEKFQYYLARLIKISKEQGKEYVFLTAWNEWGEGAYLEPDSESKYEYLEALRNAQKLD